MEGLDFEIHIGLITRDVAYVQDEDELIEEEFNADFLLDRNGLARNRPKRFSKNGIDNWNLTIKPHCERTLISLFIYRNTPNEKLRKGPNDRKNCGHWKRRSI